MHKCTSCFPRGKVHAPNKHEQYSSICYRKHGRQHAISLYSYWVFSLRDRNSIICFAPTSQITNQTERGKSPPLSISLRSNRFSRNKQYDYDVISLGNIFLTSISRPQLFLPVMLIFVIFSVIFIFSTTTSGFFFFLSIGFCLEEENQIETIIGNSNRYSDKTQMTKIPFRPRILNSVLAARALYALESACKRSGIVKP